MDPVSDRICNAFYLVEVVKQDNPVSAQQAGQLLANAAHGCVGLIKIDKDESKAAAAAINQTPHDIAGAPENAAVATLQSAIAQGARGGLLEVRLDLDRHHAGAAPGIERRLTEERGRQAPGRSDLQHVAVRKIGEF